MVAIAIFTVVSTGASLTFSMGIKAYRRSVAEADASTSASTTLLRIAHGIGDNCGLRAAFVPVSTLQDNNGWLITFTVPKMLSGDEVQVNQLRYNKEDKTISLKSGNDSTWQIIGQNIINSSISASDTSVQITVEAQAEVGYNSVSSTKTSTISFRN
jgi:nicotinamide mononucleotide adenylyltransferase